MKRNLILILVVVGIAVAQQPVLTKVGSVVKIDQTTPGTTNGVQVNAALPAGANVIGHVIADSGSTTVVTGTTDVNLKQVQGATPDPCFGTMPSFFSISQTASAQIITGTASKKIYICSITIVGSDAENVTVVEGTGTTCATGVIAVPGFPAATAAAGWNFAANGGLSSARAGSIAGTSVNADNVCVLQSGSGQVSGGGSYVVQ